MEMNLFLILLRFGGVWDCFSSGLAYYLRICTFAWNGKPRNEKRKLFSLRRSQMGKRMTNSCPGRKRAAAAAEVEMGKNSPFAANREAAAAAELPQQGRE